jgi:hypothetical protein
MLCRLVPFDVKNCLVVDVISFSNLQECEFLLKVTSLAAYLPGIPLVVLWVNPKND